MSIVYELKRLIKNRPEVTVGLSVSDVELILSTLKEYSLNEFDSGNVEEANTLIDKLEDLV